LYGDGEELLDKWFKRTGKRDQVFLATKFGYVQGGKPFEVNSSYEYAKKACEASLKRLGVDTIDLCEYSLFILLHISISGMKS
jgi:aryl-alcohol dehydrogenase-like predicted oxidoreductase